MGAALNAWSQCDELFISEYVEGNSNNKALEIYNPTNDVVDLSQYRITRWQNGSANWSAQYSDLLTGTLGSRDVVVCVLDRRDTTKTGQDTPVALSLRLKADLFLSANYNVSYSMSFNGDDALSLDKYNKDLDKWIPVDIFAKIGERPTLIPGRSYGVWSDSFPYTELKGKWYTANKTLIRKSKIATGIDTVIAGVKRAINPKTYWNPSIEWDLYPIDMFDSLGFHYCLCGWPASTKEIKPIEISLFPNPAQEKTTAFLGFNLASVRVIDTKGVEVIIESSLNSNEFKDYIIWEANTTTLSSGIYLVQFRGTRGEYATARLIK